MSPWTGADLLPFAHTEPLPPSTLIVQDGNLKFTFLTLNLPKAET